MSWHPRRLADEVRRELDRFGPAGAIAEVVAAWPQAVGPAVAENAWPARIGRDGTLTVTTGSSVWAFELGRLEETIRARLADALSGPPPPRLRFVAGRLPERGRDRGANEAPRVLEVDARARREGAELAAPIEDAELRELVARAAAASLARRRGGPPDRALW